jgi:hypothetical protein
LVLLFSKNYPRAEKGVPLCEAERQGSNQKDRERKDKMMSRKNDGNKSCLLYICPISMEFKILHRWTLMDPESGL